MPNRNDPYLQKRSLSNCNFVVPTVKDNSFLYLFQISFTSYLMPLLWEKWEGKYGKYWIFWHLFTDNVMKAERLSWVRVISNFVRSCTYSCKKLSPCWDFLLYRSCCLPNWPAHAKPICQNGKFTSSTQLPILYSPTNAEGAVRKWFPPNRASQSSSVSQKREKFLWTSYVWERNALTRPPTSPSFHSPAGRLRRPYGRPPRTRT